MKLNESKDNKIYYKQVKVKKKKHLHTENYEEFYCNIKVFVDYGLSAAHLKKSKTLHLQRNTYNKKQKQIFFNWDSLHVRLNSHYKAWELQEKETQKDERIQKISLE